MSLLSALLVQVLLFAGLTPTAFCAPQTAGLRSPDRRAGERSETALQTAALRGGPTGILLDRLRNDLDSTGKKPAPWSNAAPSSRSGTSARPSPVVSDSAVEEVKQAEQQLARTVLHGVYKAAFRLTTRSVPVVYFATPTSTPTTRPLSRKCQRPCQQAPYRPSGRRLTQPPGRRLTHRPPRLTRPSG